MSGISLLSLGGTNLIPSTTPSTTTTSTTTTISSSVSAQKGVPISLFVLEEKLNKWMLELKEQEEKFIRQAAHVNAWDCVLQQGHNQVQELKDTLNTVKCDQTRLEAELDFIRAQQHELEQLLEPLENAVANATVSGNHQGDRQRDNMYRLVQNLDAQLRQMTDDLSKVIEHLNSSNSETTASDPVNVISRILSAHMDTLKWVDHNTQLVANKIDEISKQIDVKNVE